MNKSKKKILFTSLAVAGGFCLVLLVAIIGVFVYKDVKFKKSLPDAEAAPLMYYTNVTGNTSYFYNQEYVSVLIPTLDFKAQYVMSFADRSVDALVIKGSSELYVNLVTSLCDHLEVGTIFYPSGMKKDFLELLKKVYPQAVFIAADREGQYILGDYVFYFYGDKNNIDTKVQYGLHSFMIADNAVGSLVDKVECDFALIPYESFKASYIDVDYVVFEEGANVVLEEVMEKAMNYATHPGYNFISLCMHGLESYENSLTFNMTFAPTGKIGTQ